MTWISFQKVERKGWKTGKCLCGKRRTRTKTFYQTLNPFNKNAKGELKSYDEIVEELKAKIEQWKAEPIRCDKCETTEVAE